MSIIASEGESKPKRVRNTKVHFPCVTCGKIFERHAPAKSCSQPCRKIATANFPSCSKEKQSAATRKSYQKHKAKRRAEGLAYYYQNKNRANSLHAANSKKRYGSDHCYKLALLLRTRLNLALQRQSKKGSAVQLLGCSIQQFAKYISAQFQIGMSWHNRGIGHSCWHLDHVKPLASFDLTDQTQLAAACHFSNYQPLWSSDNIRKGNSFPAVNPAT